MTNSSRGQGPLHPIQLIAWARRHPTLLTTCGLAALALAHILQNLYFISLDQVAPFTDEYALRATEAHLRLTEGGLPAYPRFPFPPLVFLVTHLFFSLFGISLEVARSSQQLFTVILVPAVFYIGYRVAGRTAGFVAAVVTVCSPLVINVSRGYFLDYAQTSLTALAFALLLASNRYSRRGLSIALGIAVGLAMLAKWSAVFFLVIPLVMFVAPALPTTLGTTRGRLIFAWGLLTMLATLGLGLVFARFRLENAAPYSWTLRYALHVLLPVALFPAGLFALSRTRFGPPAPASPEARTVNFFLTLATTYAVFAAWVVWSADFFVAKLLVNVNPITDSATVARGLLRVVANHTPFALPLLVCGIALLLIAGERRLEKVIWPLNLICVLAFFQVLGAHPAPRYSLALVICTAVVVAYLVANSGQRRVRSVAATLIIALSLVSLIGWSVLPRKTLAEVPRDQWGVFHGNNNLGCTLLAPEGPAQAVAASSNRSNPHLVTLSLQRGLSLYQMLRSDMSRAAIQLANWDPSSVLAVNRLDLIDLQGWFEPPGVSLFDMLHIEAMSRHRTTASLTLADKLIKMAIMEMVGLHSEEIFSVPEVPDHFLIVRAHQFMVIHDQTVDLNPVAAALTRQFGGSPIHEESWTSLLGFTVTLWEFPRTAEEAHNGNLPLLRTLTSPTN